jgi:hypothetical protein
LCQICTYASISQTDTSDAFKVSTPCLNPVVHRRNGIWFQATPVSLGSYSKWEDVAATQLPVALADVSVMHLLAERIFDPTLV